MWGSNFSHPSFKNIVQMSGMLFVDRLLVQMFDDECGDPYHNEGGYVTSSYFLLNNSPTCVSISFVLNTGFFVTRGQTKDTIAKMEAQNSMEKAMAVPHLRLDPILELTPLEEIAPPKCESYSQLSSYVHIPSQKDYNAFCPIICTCSSSSVVKIMRASNLNHSA